VQSNRGFTLATLVMSIALAGGTEAATITWTGAGGNNSWHTAANWDLGRVPEAGDDVVIPDMTPDVNVTYPPGAVTTINSLTSAEAFTFSGGTLTIEAASTLNGAFAMGNGTLSGAGDVTVNGPMTWNGSGLMSGTGRTIIAAGGSLTLSSTGGMRLSRTLENHSANATWTGGQIQFINGTFSNESDGTFTANPAASFLWFTFGGTSAVNNAGTINKAGAGTWTISGIALNNTGTVNLDAGALTIGGGGTNTTTIDADLGASLNFSASYTHGASSALTGQGTLTFSGGTHTISGSLDTNRIINLNATVNFNAPYTFSGTVNMNGTLGGTGDATITGTMNWTGGEMSGTGKTIIAPAGSLTITNNGGGSVALNRRLENHSPNMTWNATGGFGISNGTTLSNESAGTFTANLGTNFNLGNNGSTFTNAGTFNKVGAGTLGSFAVFVNSGTINLDAGGLNIGGTNTGTIDADAGTTLTLSNMTHDPASALTGQGTLTFAGGPHNIACTLSTDRIINIDGTVNFNAPYTFAGTMNLTGILGILGGSGDLTFTGTMNWTESMIMSGAGRTIIAPTGVLTISGGSGNKTLSRTLENHSPNASWTGTGLNFNFNNGTLSNESDATFTAILPGNLSFGVAGGTNAINNAGTFIKTGAGSLTVNSGIEFNNTGTVNVESGALTLTGGGANSGTIDAEAGTTLTFASSYGHGATSALLGTGRLTFSVGTHDISGTLDTNRIIDIGTPAFFGPTVNFNAPYTFAGTMNLTGILGILGGSGDLTFTGTMNWTESMIMSGAGRTIIAPTGVLTISGGSGNKTLSRTLENHSPNASWTGAGLNINFNNGTLSNESDGTFTAILPGNLSFGVAGGTNAINNAGTFIKTGAGSLTANSGIPFSNPGTLNVQAGVLGLDGGLTNATDTTLTGGTYMVSGILRYPAADIVTNAATIILDGPTSAIQNTSGGNGMANFAMNAANGTFQIRNGRNFALAGGFSNAGQVTIGPGDNTFSATTVNNSGTITKPAGGNGSINASVSQTAGGIIDVQDGVLTLTSLTNFSGTTLTGGTYQTTGTLRFGNADIVDNAANIILDGPASAIEDTLGANALTDLVANAAGGAIQIKNGRNLTLSGNFSNAGQVTIGPGDDALSLPGNYVQTAGFTKLDGGSLDPADLVDIQGGELRGNGPILGNVTNSGTCKPGLTPGSISISGDYTQTTAGTLEAEIGGTTAGTEYDTLSVSGRAILLGTLRVELIDGFEPAIGDTFDIVTGGLISTKFATIDMPTLPNLFGLQLDAQEDALLVHVIDCGPADADGDGVGDACETAPDLSWHTIDGGGATFSSGGQFRVGATIGQPDAGVLAGGEFELVGGFWAAATLEVPSPGDFNGDGSVDLEDFEVLSDCLTGPGLELGIDCSGADVDGDGDVDLLDFANLQALFE